MRPLILISNDDGVEAKGLKTLVDAVRDFGDIVVMSTDANASGKAHSITGHTPLTVNQVCDEDGLKTYTCNGTPVDCVKLGEAFFCGRRPDIVLSGINHGSNASVNVVYSGTMGAALEATINGYDAVGFSLLSMDRDADFSACVPFVREIVADVLENGLPKGMALNVNVPDLPLSEIKGMKVCRQAKAAWADSYESRPDPVTGKDMWWLTGNFECHEDSDDTDIYALDRGYVTVVPTRPDLTDYDRLKEMQKRFNK